ncbi:50S ribosomal protein L17 [Salinivirga cyanobacteriivorans]|uniref:Large ribosomal subunit protein bL17 n=1 Tax=Salinivirga cyanobacteriivorans TaxID=1307839 RepID=A0A0S2I2Y7_9BACT|nr:50S ribosomal protein L17 [Salinivirga cyanobacteriivorans]ALO16689.1 50S ribosomal protein L17 [Salinivirga cyanobacteriivorans]
MRHNKKFNHLGRQHGHRSAMLSNMASSLIMHKRIKTTVPKAKALRTFVEPLITKSKVDSTHSRRVVFSYLQNKDSVSELFRDVAVKVGDRPGGYTRILKLGTRVGDNADMCIIELVDYNENMLKDSKDSKSKSSRRRRRKKSSGTDAQAQTAQDTQAQSSEQDTKPEAEIKEEPKAETKKAAPKAEAKKAEPKAEKKAAPKKDDAKTSEKAEAKKEAPKKEEKKEAKPKAEKAPKKEDDKKAGGEKDAEENK